MVVQVGFKAYLHPAIHPAKEKIRRFVLATKPKPYGKRIIPPHTLGFR